MTERSRDPSADAPLNGPEPELEDKLRELAGYRPANAQGGLIDASDVEDLGELTSTARYEGELEAGVDDDLPDDSERLELLTEQELRADETDDVMEAVEEGYTYVPPIDPPTVPSRDGEFENAEIASGLGLSSLEEPYDADHHQTFLSSDDEIVARIKEAIRADSSTTAYAGRIAVEARNGIITLRGVVDDMLDSDNLLAVAEYVEGVEEVVDELRIKGM
ncbi:MAG TPA: BON domain-containing protein [Roseiflexaceae bacterium]|nr:BON domain-containing protein [Roseiflexaceae bacterium]